MIWQILETRRYSLPDFWSENLKDVLPKLVDTLDIAILSIIIVYTIAFKSISNGLVSGNTGAFQRVSPHHKHCATQRTLQFGNISAPFLAGGGDYSGSLVTGMIDSGIFIGGLI